MLRLLRKKLNKLAQNYTFFSKYANNHERKCKKTDFFLVSYQEISIISSFYTSIQYFSHTHFTTLGGISLSRVLMATFKSFSIFGIICLNHRQKVRLLTPAAWANSDFNIDFISWRFWSLFHTLVIMRVMLGFAVHACLHPFHFLKGTDIRLARVYTVFRPEQHIVGCESKELGWYLCKSVSHSYHIHLALSPTNHQFMDDLFRPCREVCTTVIKDDDTAFEVMQYTHCPLRVKDMPAHSVKHEVFFCP
mgnify:CR=1 FL=1